MNGPTGANLGHMNEDIFIVVRSKGQVVIPAALREKLGIRSGTRVAIRSEENQLILQPINDAFIRSLRGRSRARARLQRLANVNTSAKIEPGAESYQLGIDNWSSQIKR